MVFDLHCYYVQSNTEYGLKWQQQEVPTVAHPQHQTNTSWREHPIGIQFTQSLLHPCRLQPKFILLFFAHALFAISSQEVTPMLPQEHDSRHALLVGYVNPHL